MWNLFRRKREGGRGPAAAHPSDRVHELANTLQREGRAKELEGELTKLDLQTLSTGELESWWHLYGITAFQDGREAEALARFQKGYERFPASVLIRFSLGQQYIRTGAVDEGFALFRAGRFPEIPREYALAQARYAYLWNRYDDGFRFLRPFFDAYQELKILDDHFLYVRGLPFFGQWW
jgi:tetratricopeptide (TPR) repeat protein